MYAIIKNSGKQYKVKKNGIIKIEKINLNIGEKFNFTDVLIGQTSEGNIKVGDPTVRGAKVVAEIIKQGRHSKVKIIKFNRRKHRMKSQGHRQYFTALKILSISL